MIRVWITAAVVAVAHIATAGVYGYHRDEFYYLAQGRRLAWGYVDNPPLTPFLYRVGADIFGTSRFGLRVVPALLHALLVVVVALVARELGGNSRAMFLSALGAALAPMFVTTGHFLGTATPEIVAGAFVTLFVARVFTGGDPRWWLAAGGALGLGLLDHWTLAFFAVGLFVGIVVTRKRIVLASPWLYAGLAIAAVIVAPNVAWQARHHWVQLTFASHVRDYGQAASTVPAQFVVLGAASVILAIPGLLWLLRDDSGRPFKAFAIAYFVAIALTLVTGGKQYYSAAAYPVLFAAGGVALMRTSDWLRPALLVGIGLALAPVSTPLLPYATANTVRALNPEIGEMIGWSAFVDRIAPIAAAHPDAPILTSNYSEAGSIELLGKSRGIREPVSGHVTYWYWGHPSGTSQETIVIGYHRERLLRDFSDVELITTIHTPHDVDNQENGAPVWLCRGQKQPWDVFWPTLKHY